MAPAAGEAVARRRGPDAQFMSTPSRSSIWMRHMQGKAASEGVGGWLHADTPSGLAGSQQQSASVLQHSSWAPTAVCQSGSQQQACQQLPAADLRRCLSPPLRCRCCCVNGNQSTRAVGLAVGLYWTVPCAQKLVACNPNLAGKVCWDQFWTCTKSGNAPGDLPSRACSPGT